MLKLDGSKLEGGGQLTRMALCLSAITGKAIQIHSIRAGRGSKSAASRQRSPPAKDKRSTKGQKGSQQQQRSNTTSAGGLKESHLAALRWLGARTYADIDGAEVGSTEVTFRPGVLKGKYGPGVSQPASETGDGIVRDTIQLKNPGSVWLIFQAIYPFMVFGSHGHQPTNPSKQDLQDKSAASEDENHHGERLVYDLTLIGGTNVPKSMSTEYVQQVFLPVCATINLPRVEINTVKSGWTTGPLEVGEVNVKIYSRPNGRDSGSGNDNGSDGESNASNLPAFNITERGTITRISVTVVSAPHLFPVLSDLLTTTISSHPTFRSLPDQPEIETHATQDSGHERRLYILLVAHTSSGLKLGRDFLGSGGKTRNVREEETILTMAAKGVVDALMREIDHGGCVDEFMQDQIVTLQALACGSSVVRGGDAGGVEEGNLSRRDHLVAAAAAAADGGGEDESADRGGSLHTRTVRWVCEQILDGVEFVPGGMCRKV